MAKKLPTRAQGLKAAQVFDPQRRHALGMRPQLFLRGYGTDDTWIHLGPAKGISKRLTTIAEMVNAALVDLCVKDWYPGHPTDAEFHIQVGWLTESEVHHLPDM